MDDIVALILDDHACIRRLFAASAAAGDPVVLSTLSAQLTEALLAHLDAAREICYLPFLNGSFDGSLTMLELCCHDHEICDAVAETRLHEAGSPLWRLATRAARDAADRHIAFIESGPLRKFQEQTPWETRLALGHQWQRYLGDLRRAGPLAEAPLRFG